MSQPDPRAMLGDVDRESNLAKDISAALLLFRVDPSATLRQYLTLRSLHFQEANG